MWDPVKYVLNKHKSSQLGQAGLELNQSLKVVSFTAPSKSLLHTYIYLFKPIFIHLYLKMICHVMFYSPWSKWTDLVIKLLCWLSQEVVNCDFYWSTHRATCASWCITKDPAKTHRHQNCPLKKLITDVKWCKQGCLLVNSTAFYNLMINHW